MNHSYKCGQPEIVSHILKICVLCEHGRRYLREISSEFDFNTLLDSKKNIKAVAKLFHSLLHLLN